ncbi:MAG: hypothetical protein AAFZ07_28535 [Actinomycetota bacterium]
MNRLNRIARTTLVSAALAGGALVAVPAVAGAQDDDTTTTDPSTEVAPESGRLGNFLDGLVEQGVISAEQADAIVEAFSDAREERQAAREERRAEQLAIVTDVLGLDEEALEAAREEGQTLADLAEQQGVSVETLVDALMEPKLDDLDERVAAGELTEEEAAERAAEIEERVTARVNGERPERGEGFHGRRSGFGRGFGGGFGGGDAELEDTVAA